MKKIVSLLLLVTMISALLAVCLTGCGLFKTPTVDEVKANLENAGYEVEVMTGEEYIEEGEFSFLSSTELKNVLYGQKGEDRILVFFFDSTDTASEYSNLINDPDLLSGQSNSVLYLATKQARKDAGV